MTDKPSEEVKERMHQQVTEMFKELPTQCRPSGDCEFGWVSTGIGFGSFRFWVSEEDNVLHCDNEAMSKQFIKDMLCQMVDECVMDIPNKKDES